MRSQGLKLKQASAVLGVSPKDLQNFVQHGVLRPKRRARTCWFDADLLLQAKLAFYLKDSLRISTEYLARITREFGRLDAGNGDSDELSIFSDPGGGKSPVEIRVPLRELRTELEEVLPLAALYQDLPRGRKRPGWKQRFLSTLRDAADEMGDISEERILEAVREYRAKKRRQPEIRLVPQTTKTA